jgi:hypothetical protein
MRDLVPRKSPARKNTVTPWSTYDHFTPIRLPKLRTNRPSLSPSPVAHSKSPIPPSPVRLVNEPEGEDSDRETPSILEYPHESMQLPRRTAISRKIKSQRPPIEVIEDFIRDIPFEAKEAVRATYNGPDWPGKRPSLVGGNNRKSIAALSSYSAIMPPVFSPPVSNRFLVGLPSYNPPQVVYHYFPRGC